MKRKKKTKTMYFTSEVDDAIVKINSGKLSHDDREKLYNEKVHGPMRELVHSIINTFKFYETCGESVNDLMRECLSFLYEKLPKFNKESGKAFSYFSIACKNYLIQKSTSNMKNRSHSINIEVLDVIAEHNEGDNTSFSIDEDEFDKNIFKNKLLECINSFVDNSKKENDKLVGIALYNVFNNPHSFEIFNKNTYNKKTVYLLLREQTGLKTKAITRIINKIERQAYHEYKEWRKQQYS